MSNDSAEIKQQIRIEELEAKVVDALLRYHGALAEFENYNKRGDPERQRPPAEKTRLAKSVAQLKKNADEAELRLELARVGIEKSQD